MMYSSNDPSIGGDAPGNRIAEYVLDTSSWEATFQRVVLDIQQLYWNHNGGALVFGPDGFLYITIGDGGSGNDPQNVALNMDSQLGKV